MLYDDIILGFFVKNNCFMYMDGITLHSTSDCSAYKYNLFIYTL